MPPELERIAQEDYEVSQEAWDTNSYGPPPADPALDADNAASSDEQQEQVATMLWVTW